MTIKQPGYLALVCAACCGAGTAQAQSSVTIYGRVDLGLFHQNSGKTPINAGNATPGERWEVRQGSAGRVGFRGTEDMGGGLKASFILEHRFRADTGESETPYWQARSFVELSSTQWGAVYLGREYFPAFWPAFKLDPWGFDTVGTPGTKHQLANYTVDGGTRSNNTVGYKTPNWGGLTGQFAVSAGEGLRSNSVGGNLEYTAGPWYLAAAFDKVDANQKLALVGGAYDFGPVRLAVTYAEATVTKLKNSNVSVTARIPVGTDLIKLGASRLKLGGATALAMPKVNTRFGVGYEHFLSKRTSILADVGTAKQTGLSRTTLFDLNLKHNF